MWIVRFTYCLFRKHAFIDITSSRRPYQYCMRCGYVKEPVAILKSHRVHIPQAHTQPDLAISTIAVDIKSNQFNGG
jgi:hypothetical protein